MEFTEATVDDLYRIRHKAELVAGRILNLWPTEPMAGHAASEVLVSLRRHEKSTRVGRAVGGNAGFLVELPDRRSFCPDAAFHIGPCMGMKFYDRAPVFAVEVRHVDERGADVELAIADKRSDYFAAGTLVVGDVDLLSDDVVRVYRSTAPEAPTVYRRGDTAEAEPAVPGWRMPVNDLFPE
jgi:Uma2 family endonuclease